MIGLGSDVIKPFTPKRSMSSRYFRKILRKRKIKKIYEK